MSSHARVGRWSSVAAATAAIFAVAAPAAGAAGVLNLDPQAAQTVQQAKAAGVPMDTSAAALGDPAHPTAQDVARDFRRLHWPAALLPAPSVLADPAVRDWLGMVNSPASKVTSAMTTLSAVPPGGPPAPTPAAPATTPVPFTGPAAERGGRRTVARAAQTYAYLVVCSVTLSSAISGGTSYALGGFSCALPVYFADQWAWFSMYTGSLLDTPTIDWNLFANAPRWSAAAGSNTSRGQSHHRLVNFNITLCLPQGTCAGTTLWIVNT